MGYDPKRNSGRSLKYWLYRFSIGNGELDVQKYRLGKQLNRSDSLHAANKDAGFGKHCDSDKHSLQVLRYCRFRVPATMSRASDTS